MTSPAIINVIRIHVAQQVAYATDGGEKRLSREAFYRIALELANEEPWGAVQLRDAFEAGSQEDLSGLILYRALEILDSAWMCRSGPRPWTFGRESR